MFPAPTQVQGKEETSFLSFGQEEGHVRMINVKPVQVIGSCPANLTLDDEFQIEGMSLKNPRESNICFLALGQIPIGQGIWQLQSEEQFFCHVSCPGCTLQLDRENRVVLLLGHADKWRLCQLISEYLRLCKQYEEPETARRVKEEAIQFQNRGEYPEATQKMEVALQEFKAGAGLHFHTGEPLS